MHFSSLDKDEFALGWRLTLVVAMRMLGLFLILPVFMLLARDMPGYTPTLAGIAIGVYGLTQAILQQPLGRLSDRLGRRRVIVLGLITFGLGSVMAALATSIQGLIVGRALQGCGAIAGVTLAWAADASRPSQRSTVMGMIGMGIGASFLLSIMISVPLSSVVGLQGIFWFTALLGGLGLLVLRNVPGGDRPETDTVVRRGDGMNSGIHRLAVSVFFLHAQLTMLFVALPGSLVADYGLDVSQHWKIYVPGMLIAAGVLFPLLRILARLNREHLVLPWAFLVLGMSTLAFIMPLPGVALMIVVVLFFLAFNLLEATMPTLVSHLSGSHGRGWMMGRYTTFQFLGAFAGGVLGGWLLEHSGPIWTLTVSAWLAGVWALFLTLELVFRNREI